MTSSFLTVKSQQIAKERVYSHIYKQLSFLEEVIPEKAESTFRNGLLEVSIPKKTVAPAPKKHKVSEIATKVAFIMLTNDKTNNYQLVPMRFAFPPLLRVNLLHQTEHSQIDRKFWSLDTGNFFSKK